MKVYVSLIGMIAVLSGSQFAEAQNLPLAFQSGPFVEASPCPVPFGPGDGVTTLRWDAKSPAAEVTVNTGNGEQSVSTTPAGRQTIAWINVDAVYEFRLYRGVTRKDLIGMVRVTRNHGDAQQAMAVEKASTDQPTTAPSAPSAAQSKARTVVLFVALTLLPLGFMGLGAWREKAGISARLLWAYPAAVVLLAGVLGGINLWWLEHFRRGMPIDIDESQFYVDAIDQAGFLRQGDFDGFIERFERSSWHSPLLPLSLAVCAVPLGDDPFLGYAVLHGYYILLLLSTYGIARRFSSPSASLLATFVLATSPGILYYCRTFFVELPTGALFTAAIYAMLRSEQGRNLKWSAAMGLCVGLANLMRPLCLALAPSFYVALALQWLIVPDARRKRIVGLLIALSTGVATSALYYFYFNGDESNLKAVMDYLTNYGYGSQTTFYNDGRISFHHPLAILTYRLRVIVNQGFFLYLAIALTVIGAMGATLRYRRNSGPIWSKRRLFALCGGSAASVAIVTGYVYVMLTTSLNEGDGFMLVILPVFAIAPIALFWDVAPRWARITTASTVLLLGILHTIVQADLCTALAESHDVSLPEIGSLRIVDGWGRVQENCSYVGFTGAPTRLSPEFLGWMKLNNDVLTYIQSQTALEHVHLIIGLRDPVFNFSTLDLIARTDFDSRLESDVFKVDDKVSPDQKITIKDYRFLLKEHLTDSDYKHAERTFFVLGEQTAHELQPSIDQAMATQAALEAGFKLGKSLIMPDGRRLIIMERDR